MSIEEFELYHAKKITCPYCRHEYDDSWELAGADGEEEERTCEECGGAFICTTHIEEVRFTTRKKEATS